jgi:hypothetical protein
MRGGQVEISMGACTAGWLWPPAKILKTRAFSDRRPEVDGFIKKGKVSFIGIPSHWF